MGDRVGKSAQESSRSAAEYKSLADATAGRIPDLAEPHILLRSAYQKVIFPIVVEVPGGCHSSAELRAGLGNRIIQCQDQRPCGAAKKIGLPLIRIPSNILLRRADEKIRDSISIDVSHERHPRAKFRSPLSLCINEKNQN